MVTTVFPPTATLNLGHCWVPALPPPDPASARPKAVMRSVMRGMKAAMAAANRKVQEIRAADAELAQKLKELDAGDDPYSDWDVPSGVDLPS
jgi:hypothetical protein